MQAVNQARFLADLKPGDLVLCENPDHDDYLNVVRIESIQIAEFNYAPKQAHVTYTVDWELKGSETYVEAWSPYEPVHVVNVDGFVIEKLIVAGLAAPAARDMPLAEVLEQIRGANALG